MSVTRRVARCADALQAVVLPAPRPRTLGSKKRPTREPPELPPASSQKTLVLERPAALPHGAARNGVQWTRPSSMGPSKLGWG